MTVCARDIGTGIRGVRRRVRLRCGLPSDSRCETQCHDAQETITSNECRTEILGSTRYWDNSVYGRDSSSITGNGAAYFFSHWVSINMLRRVIQARVTITRSNAGYEESPCSPTSITAENRNRVCLHTMTACHGVACSSDMPARLGRDAHGAT